MLVVGVRTFKAKEDLEDLISTVKKDCKKLLAHKRNLNRKLKDTYKSRINYVTAAGMCLFIDAVDAITITSAYGYTN